MGEINNSNSAKISTDKVEASKVEAPKKSGSVNSDLDENITTTGFLSPNPQNVLNGIIWSEILGKPRALRKGR